MKYEKKINLKVFQSKKITIKRKNIKSNIKKLMKDNIVKKINFKMISNKQIVIKRM
jgi:hypothetical protein